MLESALATASIDSRLEEAWRKAALRTALELSDEYATRRERMQELSVERRAETHYMIGHLLSGSDANEALTRFREAEKLVPKEAKYAEATRSLLQGADAYRREQQRKAAEAERERLKQLEEEEDLAWEEDEKDGGFSDTR